MPTILRTLMLAGFAAAVAAALPDTSAFAAGSGSGSSDSSNSSSSTSSGNDYDKAFQIIAGRATYTLDSFECAIHKLAPLCAHCGCRVVGHGVETQGVIYCCANCARMSGSRAVTDRA